MTLPPRSQSLIERFTTACRADARIVAAFLGGSYARGAADAYSDLDLYLVTTDEAYAEFMAGREAFVRSWGEPIFLESFGLPTMIFFILADGAEGELGVGHASDFKHLHGGPYQVLVDKNGLLEGMVFPLAQPEPAEQHEKLRRQIYWFWHDLSHFITALGRGQLWWAQGQLEILRRCCLNLARLQHNLADADAGDEVYFKIDRAVPPEALAELEATFCPLERGAMFEAALVMLSFYQAAAREAAQANGIDYPARLERVLVGRLMALGPRGDA